MYSTRFMFFTGVLILFSIATSYGQQIVVDSLAVESWDLHLIKGSKFVFQEETQYVNSPFYEDDKRKYLPFHDVNFDEYILVGYKYYGSNCDPGIRARKLIRKDSGYLIQFYNGGTACRDMSLRIVWFIIEKPKNSRVLSFDVERVGPSVLN